MMEQNKLRVLFYTYPMIGQNYGGLQIQIENTARCLQNLGCEVKFFNQWTDKVEDYDILHCFYLGDIGAAPLVKRAKEKGIGVVMSTVYNSALDKKKEQLSYQLSRIHPSICYVKYVQREIVKSVDRFVALSDYEKEAVHTIFKIPNDKFSIIPNGISDMFHQEPKQENVFVDKTGLKDYVLHVGQFTRNKNQIAIIKALKDTNIPLVCIGQVVENDYYEECKKLAGENIHFFEPVDNTNSQLLEMYWAAKAFVLPSYREAYPLSVIEAVLTGNHVLVTSNSMIGSSLDSFGVEKVSPDNVSGIKAWIERNIEKEKAEITQEQKQQFSWTDVAQNLLRVYTEVMNECNKTDCKERISCSCK